MKINGQLEVDKKRGVIYFHDKNGITRMRIQGLPAPISTENKFMSMLDIKIVSPVVANWCEGD